MSAGEVMVFDGVGNDVPENDIDPAVVAVKRNSIVGCYYKIYLIHIIMIAQGLDDVADQLFKLNLFKLDSKAGIAGIIGDIVDVPVHFFAGWFPSGAGNWPFPAHRL